ncbi:MAG: CGNR zinc finger domain-containing protein [Acidobacteriota bacterium]
MVIRKRKNTARNANPPAAPGELELVRAFVSSRGDERTGDQLASAEGWASWLLAQGLVKPEVTVSEKDRQQAVAAREAIRSMLAVHTGAAPAQDLVQRFMKAAGKARMRLHFDNEGPASFQPASDTPRDILGLLMARVAMGRRGSDWQLIKLCERPGCHHAFFDVSQNHKGKWCTRRCGNRVRTERHRKSDRYSPFRW